MDAAKLAKKYKLKLTDAQLAAWNTIGEPTDEPEELYVAKDRGDLVLDNWQAGDDWGVSYRISREGQVQWWMLLTREADGLGAAAEARQEIRDTLKRWGVADGS